MMMDWCHAENTLPGALEPKHLNDDGQGFDHKKTTDNGQHKFVMCDDGNSPERASEREAAGQASALDCGNGVSQA